MVVELKDKDLQNRMNFIEKYFQGLKESDWSEWIISKDSVAALKARGSFGSIVKELDYEKTPQENLEVLKKELQDGVSNDIPIEYLIALLEMLKATKLRRITISMIKGKPVLFKTGDFEFLVAQMMSD